jgi:hypothetical protein
MADEPDDIVKAKFAKELKLYYLGAYLNTSVIKQIENRARQGKVENIVSNPENLS